MSGETIDDFLLDLDPNRRRRRLRAEADAEAEPPKPKSVDADQGVRGLPLGGEKKASPDSWLMAVTDEGRHGAEGVHDEDYYRTYF